jgi:predicted ATPase/DNA-binding winged helix-turn-helix (wHTH) protein
MARSASSTLPMTDTQPRAASIRYRGWEIRPAERLLVVDGRAVAVGSRALDVLMALVDRQGRVASKADLLEMAWPGLVVEENNISVQIAALRKVLGPKEIATVPGIGYRLAASADAGPEAPPLEARHAGRRPAAPPHDEILGRDADLGQLVERLRDTVLLSIVGVGGVGKTSLARELLARQETFPASAVRWVDLAPIQEPGQFPLLLAKTLDIALEPSADAADVLLAALGQMNFLVAVDNCEHLLAEVAGFIHASLARAPAVRWLTTSQEPLHVPGEVVHRLEPLAVPGHGVSVAQALEFGAIALLCQRAVAADRRFRLREDNLDAAIDLCAQLDGVPLAIEMAAARVATFGLDEVRQRLGQRLRLLAGREDAGYRHATLQATFDWSYGLLSEAEQAVFRRLEPFLGGFRADMAQQVAADAEGGGIDAWQALDALVALVDKSLVQRSPGAPGRFHLLESAREYARTRLEAAGELAATRRRHAVAVAAWFAHAPTDAERMTDSEWSNRYGPERHNARAALAWACREGSPDDLARLAAALAMIDSFLCRQAEILRCELPFDVLARAAPGLRGAACLELSWSHYLDGDRAFAAELAREACEVFESLGDDARTYRALAQLTRLHEATPGMAAAAEQAWARLRRLDDRRVPLRTRLFCNIAAGLRFRPDLTVAHMQEFERLAKGSGFDALAGICRANITDKLLVAGRDEDVVALARQEPALRDELPRVRAAILHNEMLAMIRLGRTDEAYAPARAAFQAMPSAAHFLVDTFALAAAREGRFADAAVLHGCGERVRQERSEKSDIAEQAAIAETAALLEQSVDAAQLSDLKRLGAAMTPADALALKVFPRCAPRAMGGAPAAPPGRSSSGDAP